MVARYLVLFNIRMGPPAGELPAGLLHELQSRLPAGWTAWAETALTGVTRRVTSANHWVDYAVKARHPEAPDRDFIYHDCIVPADVGPDGRLRASVGPVNSRIALGMQSRGSVVYLWNAMRIVEVAEMSRVKGGGHDAVGKDEPRLRA